MMGNESIPYGPNVGAVGEYAGGGIAGLGDYHKIPSLTSFGRQLGFYGAGVSFAANLAENGVSPHSVSVSIGSAVVGFATAEAVGIAISAGFAAAGITVAPVVGAAAVVVGGILVGYVAAGYAHTFIDNAFVNYDPADTQAISDLGPQPCFPASTPIRLGDDSTANIESIQLNDTVACTIHSTEVLQHDNGTVEHVTPVTASLRTGTVARLYNNLTEEWITLAIPQPDGSVRLLTATPGHVMLSPDGSWRKLCDMIDGSVVPLNANALEDAAQGELAWRDAAGCAVNSSDASSNTIPDHVAVIADGRAIGGGYVV